MPVGERSAFVLCIEDNQMRDQALMLIASIRAFGGRHADAEIFAVAPREGLGVDAPTRAQLESQYVTYHEEALNTVCPEYASANRLYSAAWAAGRSRAETLFVLDSDTFFLGEPEPLGEDCDLAIRPVDVKGSASGGPGDPYESYWSALCALAGSSLDDLPWVETALDRQLVRASYNGGYSVVRRESGILERAADLFTRSVRLGLRPGGAVDGTRVHASTGFVSALASQYWGSNQAALSVAAWSRKARVRLLDRPYNVPVHGLAEPGNWREVWRDLRPIHVHYHWMLDERHREKGMDLLARLGVPREQLEWVAERCTGGARRPVVATAMKVAARRDDRRPPEGGRQLVICGMHRSATSLAASVLRHAGLDLGSRMNGPGIGNPRGHFEDVDFWRLHEETLAAAGHTALSAGDDLRGEIAEGFAERASALVAARSELAVWGFKDPRTCLFLDLWHDVLPDPRYLFLFRHPVDVVLSLLRRGTEPELREDPALAFRSWEAHNMSVLDFCRRHRDRCYLAQVPAFTSDLDGVVATLTARFDLPLKNDGAASLYSREELAPQRADAERPPWRSVIPRALEIYRLLDELADVPGARPRAGAADIGPVPREVRDSREFQTATLTESLLFDVMRHSLGQHGPAEPDVRAALQAQSAELQAQSAELQAQSAELQSKSAQLGGERELVSQLRRRLAVAEARLGDAAARRDELAATLAEIERSRGYGLVAGWWKISKRLRPRRRLEGGDA